MTMFDITITDKDIDQIEELMGGDVCFDDARRTVIKSLDSIDVQAFPGTGKTTIVLAKLSLLLSKWNESNRGICVLSHTNVAKEEIQRRLSKSSIGQKAGSYPHFIGTVHAFLDAFVSMPWLKSNGYKVTEIDDESVLSKRYFSLPFKARAYLDNSNQGPYNCESFSFPNINLKINCKETSPSHQQVSKCISDSFRAGYFTFNEMLLVAKHALSDNPSLAKAIQTRFPIVIIDEAQDTSDLQWEIINLIFPRDGQSIIQLFGDKNQAIYGSYSSKESGSNYPSLRKLSLINSKRFGTKIAGIANTLSLENDLIVSDNDTYNFANNFIILFDNGTMGNVIPTFFELVSKSFDEAVIKREEKYGIHIIGMVHNKEPENDSDKYPNTLKCYWNNYKPEIVSKKFNYLIDYFREANRLEAFNEKANAISKGIIRLLNLCLDEKISPYGNSSLNALLKNIDIKEQTEFKTELLRIINLKTDDQNSWNLLVDSLLSLIKKWFDLSIDSRNSFLEWNGETADATRANNEFSYETKNGQTLNAEFGSIHSVKGRTHFATLVLETFWFDMNIKSILPWLTNSGDKKPAARNLQRIRCHFVALTRAKGMVCIALKRDSVTSKDLEKLEGIGWKIHNLCSY